MPKFRVYMNNVERLQAQEIEADDAEQAKEKYLDLWNCGYVAVDESNAGGVGAEWVEEIK